MVISYMVILKQNRGCWFNDFDKAKDHSDCSVIVYGKIDNGMIKIGEIKEIKISKIRKNNKLKFIAGV